MKTWHICVEDGINDSNMFMLRTTISTIPKDSLMVLFTNKTLRKRLTMWVLERIGEKDDEPKHGCMYVNNTLDVE